MRIRLTSLIGLLWLLTAPTAQASLAQLETFFATVDTLRAEFSQKVVDETGMALDFATGTLYLSRPGKFRWDYHSPDPDLVMGQQIVADGESIFMYDPDLEQVTQRGLQDALGQVPSLLLVQDEADLEAHFLVSDIGLTDGLSWVALKPRAGDAGYQQLMIGFDQAIMRSIVLLDGLGNETRLVLSTVANNPELDPALFSFTVPAGADLLKE